jgi:glycerate kinase
VRVLVCPDKFAGTLSAPEAAAAIAEGWRAGAPTDALTVRPLADGGPGFLDAVASATDQPVRLVVQTPGPFGDPVDGSILLTGSTAYVEAAQACGLHLVAPPRDPTRTTSYGVGVLVAAAIDAGAETVIIGLGGSGTNDGGAGMLAALGAAPIDAAGAALPDGGGALVDCAGLSGVPRVAGVRIVGASDVDNPLVGPRGASAVFGPQKGATADQVSLLDGALARFAAVLERALPGCPTALAQVPGSGAAGGLGAAILACGGTIVSGFAVVAGAVGLDAALDACDLVITGEGSFDDQSLHGKVVSGVAAAARARGVPCIVLAGRVSADAGAAADAGVTRAYGLVDHLDGDVRRAMAEPATALRSLAAAVAARVA